MLHSYWFKNYKAFSHGQIDIRPLTILLGANNAGKTSILQVPLLMQQTAIVQDERYPSALKLNGRITSAGTPENLFPGKMIDKPITWGFSFHSQSLAEEIKDAALEFTRQVYWIYRGYLRLYDAYYNERGRKRSKAKARHVASWREARTSRSHVDWVSLN